MADGEIIDRLQAVEDKVDRVETDVSAVKADVASVRAAQEQESIERRALGAHLERDRGRLEGKMDLVLTKVTHMEIRRDLEDELAKKRALKVRSRREAVQKTSDRHVQWVSIAVGVLVFLAGVLVERCAAVAH